MLTKNGIKNLLQNDQDSFVTRLQIKRVVGIKSKRQFIGLILHDSHFSILTIINKDMFLYDKIDQNLSKDNIIIIHQYRLRHDLNDKVIEILNYEIQSYKLMIGNPQSIYRLQ